MTSKLRKSDLKKLKKLIEKYMVDESEDCGKYSILAKVFKSYGFPDIAVKQLMRISNQESKHYWILESIWKGIKEFI